MKISINILTWNSEKHIKKCLECCLNQNYNDFDIVVIDNNSSDYTVKTIEEYFNKIKIIRNSINTGYSGGHNMGIRDSSSEYVLVLNPDVYLDKNYIKNIIEFLDLNKEYGGAIGKILQYRDENVKSESANIIDTMGLSILKSKQFIARNFGELDNHSSIATVDCFGVDGMAAVYRREMLEEVKINNEYFDEDFFAYCEDQDLSWRARRAGWKFAFINESIAFHVRTWKPKSLKYRLEIKSETKRMALRNHYLMILKNDEIIPFLLHFHFIFFRFIKIITYSILFEQKTLLAFYDFFKLFRKGIQKRKIIKKNRKVSLTEILNWHKLK